MFSPTDKELVTITGATWNRMAPLLNYIETIRNEKDKPQFNPFQDSFGTTRVRNSTGTNIEPHKVVAIGEPPVKPGDFTEDLAYKYQQVFEAEATDEQSTKIGITIEGIPEDIGSGEPGIGRVIVFGITTAIVNVTDLTHEYAKTTATNGVLLSTASKTSIRILYADAVGATELCKVMIGVNPLEQAVLTTQFQDVNYFDTVAVDVWESDGDIAISTQAIEAVSPSGYLKLLTPGKYRIQTVIEFETGSHDEAGTYGAYFWPFAEYLFRHKMFKDDFTTAVNPTTGSTYNCGGVFTQPPDYRNYSVGFARERYAQTVVVESNFEFETMPAGTDYVVVQLFAQTNNTTAFNSEKAHVERSHTHAWKI